MKRATNPKKTPSNKKVKAFIPLPPPIPTPTQITAGFQKLMAVYNQLHRGVDDFNAPEFRARIAKFWALYDKIKNKVVALLDDFNKNAAIYTEALKERFGTGNLWNEKRYKKQFDAFVGYKCNKAQHENINGQHDLITVVDTAHIFETDNLMIQLVDVVEPEKGTFIDLSSTTSGSIVVGIKPNEPESSTIKCDKDGLYHFNGLEFGLTYFNYIDYYHTEYGLYLRDGYRIKISPDDYVFDTVKVKVYYEKREVKLWAGVGYDYKCVTFKPSELADLSKINVYPFMDENGVKQWVFIDIPNSKGEPLQKSI